MDNNIKIICTCNVKLRFAQDSCFRRFDSYFNFCEDKKNHADVCKINKAKYINLRKEHTFANKNTILFLTTEIAIISFVQYISSRHHCVLF